MVFMCITLKSLKTGKVYTFEKQKYACEFLGHGRSYLYSILKSGKQATKYDNGEKFEVYVTSVHKVKRMPNYNNGKNQLCVSCARCYGLCSWSHNFTPVDGWTATETLDSDGRQYSYAVTDCPLYEEDETTIQKRREQYEALRFEYYGREKNDI